MTSQSTIGILIVSVLALASEAAKRGILGERTRIAYGGLREKIAAWSNSDATILDVVYLSDSRKRRIIDAIEIRPNDDRVTIKSMASALVESLKEDVRRGSLGISLRRLEEIHDQLTSAT